MALRSVFTLDVDDGAFKQFAALFDRYQEKLAKTPVAWATVSKENKLVASQFDRMTAALLAQAELMHKAAAAQKETARTSGHLAGAWTSMAHSTRSVAHNIGEATRHLLRWTEIMGVAGGLLGAGGLFGLDRLGSTVSAGRRSAMGLGLSYGEQSAFALDFGRFVNPGSFLGGVSAARANPALMTPLNALGMSGAEMQGDTAQVAARVLDHLRQFALATPSNQLGLRSQANRLGELGITLEDLRRMKAATPQEWAQQRAAYLKDRTGLGLSAGTQLAWQNFTTQMSRAGKEIETVFVRGLTPLAPALMKLSSAFEQAVAELLGKNGPARGWIDDLAKGITTFATYLSSPRFKSDIATFVSDFEKVVKALGHALHWIANWSTGEGAPASGGKSAWHPGPPQMPAGRALDYALHGQPPVNNPLNLRVPGSKSKFAQFPSVQAGLLKAAWQLRRDEDVHHLSTIRQLIGDPKWGWAPASDGNDTGAYIADVSRQTGFKPDQPLDLHNPATLTMLMSAMAQHESGFKKTPQQMLKIMIQNNTGGNATVTANQLPQ